MRKHLLLPTLAALTVLSARADYLFETDFNSGALPAGMTAVDNDGQTLLTTDYKAGAVTTGWTVLQVLGGSYAAVSPSHTRTDIPQSNVLSCPELTVSGANPVLRWKARSIHPYLPESYRVLVQAAGAEPVVALTVAAENGPWTSRALDLTPWLGKKVTISFECISTNRYLLAIDDIKVGDPQETLFTGHTTNGEFVGLAWDFPGQDNGTARLTGAVTNMGKAVSGGRLVLVSGGAVIATKALPATFACGQSEAYEFDLPVTLGQATAYSIAVEDASGTRTVAIESRVHASWFARTHVATEYTGLWCNNCPAAAIELEDLEHRFGSQLIKLVGHIQTANNDPMECADYRAETYAGKYFSVPRMVLNHDVSTNAANCSKFADRYDDPTPVDIEICEYTISGNRLTAKAAVTWVFDTDNADDRYRIGYVLTHDVFTDTPTDGYNQQNSATGLKSDRYYYLPTRIKSDLSHNPCTVAWGKNAGQGWAKSLPKSLKAMKTVGAPIAIELDEPADPSAPAALTDLTTARLVAYVIDTQSGNIVNACFQNLDEPCDPAHTPEPGTDPDPDPDPDPNPDPDPDPEPEVDTATLTASAPEYAAEGDFEVSAVVTSTSESGLDNWTLTFVCDGLTLTKSGELIASGAEQTVTFAAPIEADQVAGYSLTLTAEHLAEPLTAAGTVNGLAFMPERHTLLEQALSPEWGVTPAGMTIVEALDNKAEFIPVAVHAPGTPHAIAAYSDFPSQGPAFVIDRDPQTIDITAADAILNPEAEGSALARILSSPEAVTFADITLDAGLIKNAGKVTGIDVAATVIPAKTLDGSSLALCLILTENNVSDPGLSQVNDLHNPGILPDGTPFGSLPAVIPAMYYHDVAREVYGYSGLPGSIPARELAPRKKVTYRTQLSVPDNVSDPDELYLTACLLDTATGRVMNAARTPLSAGAKPKVTAADMLQAWLSIPAVDDADAGMPVRWYNLQGIPVSSPEPGQIYIRRQGAKVSKTLCR